jgi:predicted metal-dependent hydrolase
MPADSFELGGRSVDILRSARARRMRLAVDPRSGRMRLTLPPRASVRDGMRWAQEHRAWVAREAAKLPMPEVISPGMVMTVAGQPMTLVWEPRRARVPARQAEALVIGGALDDLPARLLRWLKREALCVLERETREIAAVAGVRIGRVGVGDPVSRWGSCSARGDIRYSWRLILAPDFVRRATVAHEVAHRTHMNHGADFHALVATLLGDDPRRARAWLKAHGARLHWFGKLPAFEVSPSP